MVTKETIVKDMAKIVNLGAEQIMKEHEVSEEVAILTAFKYAAEWLTENKPELTARWIETLSA